MGVFEGAQPLQWPLGAAAEQRGLNEVSPFTRKRKRLAIARQAFVRAKGLEPIRIAAPDPKSGLSTNSNTPAGLECKDTKLS